MASVVLDASAILAVLRREPGGENVVPHLRGGLVCTVNYAEILGKAEDIGIGMDIAKGALSDLGVVCVPFDESHAAVAAWLRPITRSVGLSMADRACLALAKVHALPVLTSDESWRRAEHGIEVRLFRERT